METITLDIQGVSVSVHLFTDHAPTTCQAVKDSLPLTGEAFHDIWSGRVIFVPLVPALQIPVENPTMYVVPGDVFFYERPEHLDRGCPYGYLALSEIGVVYGRDSLPSGPRGPKVINLFGHIDAGLDALARLGEQMIHTGKKHAEFRP